MELTMKQITAKFGVSRHAVYNWIARGMPAEQRFIGTKSYHVLDEDACTDWVESVRGDKRE